MANFARKFEVFVRFFLLIAFITSAFAPTRANAQSLPRDTSVVAEVDNEIATQVRELTGQSPVQYHPDDVIPNPDRFSSNADEEEPKTPEKDPVEFSISTNTGEVEANRTVTINVLVRNNSESPLSNLTYYDKLEEGLEYSSSSDTAVKYNKDTVSFQVASLNPGEEAAFSYTIKIKNKKIDKLTIHNAEIEYDFNGETRAQTASLGFADNSPQVDPDALIVVPDQTGDGWESAGRYSLYLGEEVLSQEAIVSISPADIPGNGPDLQFDLELIQTTAPASAVSGDLREQDIALNKTVETDFDAPAFLEINLDEYIDLENIPAGQEPYVATYDEELDIWVKIPILETDPISNTVTVEAAHFSTWGAGLGSSLPQNGANVLLFDQPYTSLFTGASRYSVPIWTPPGRAGMAPDVSLSYSSATVDGVLGDVQAPWTGVGWNIDGIEIVRKITTSSTGYGYVNDFALTLNGALYDLVQDNLHPSRYYTTHDAFLYIERHNYSPLFGNQNLDGVSPVNTTGEWWEVVTTDGTRYRLGWNKNSEQLALMYGYKCTTDGLSCSTPDGSYATLGYAGIAQNLVALRWRVDRITDTHGNYTEYSYKETQPVGATTIAPFDRESYLEYISYTGFTDPNGISANDLLPAYKVHFVTASRSGDVPSNFYAWDNLDSQMLDKIEICYGDCSISTNIIRSYDLGYTVASVPNPNGTLTLTSVKTTGGGYTDNGQSIAAVDAPTIQFAYQNLDNRAVTGSTDKFTYPRLLSMDNGAGGLLNYTYENDGRGTNSWYNYRVKQVQVGSGMATATLHSYAYLTPVYTGLSGNATLGDLIGYTTVTESQLDYNNNNVTILSTNHTFGITGLDTGREMKTEWVDGTGVVKRKVTNTYVTDNSKAPFPGWNFRYLYTTLTYELSAGSLALTSKVIYSKDPANGNLVTQFEYLGSSIYRKTYYEYLINSDPDTYILDRPSRVLLVDANNQIEADTRYHYDGRIATSPTTGDLTLVQQFTGHEDETTDVTTNYDVYGNTTSVQTFTGYGATGTSYTTSVDYDPTLHTYPLINTNALGQSSTTDYLYTLGVPFTVTDPNGWTTLTKYDGLGRTLSLNAPGLNQPGVHYSYPTVDANGRIYAPYAVELQILDTTVNQYRSVWGIYDGLGRMVQTQVYDADTNKVLVSDSYFNAQGLAYKQSLPYPVSAAGGYHLSPSGNQFTVTTFDALARPLTTTQPGGIVTTTSYDGLSVTVKDPNNNSVTRTSDGLGRLTAVKEYASASTLYATTSYSYDIADRLTKVLDAQGNETTINYDWLGRKTGMDDPDMGVWTYAYDALGRLTGQTDARSQVLNFTYDALNRPFTKTGTGLSVSYQYGTTAGVNGNIGMRIGMTDMSGSTIWSYANYGRTVTEQRTVTGQASQTSATVTDWLGRPISVVYPGSETLTYTYDALGRPDKLSSNLNANISLVDLAYTALGQIATQTLGNGVVVTNTYDSANRLDTHSAVKAGTSLMDFKYDYDLAGNITQIKDDLLGETHQYTYDFLNRLKTANANATGNAADIKYSQQFEYDKVGNTTRVNDWTPLAYREPEPYVDVPAVYHPASLALQANPTETPTATPTPTEILIPTNTAGPSPTASPMPTLDGNVPALLHLDGLDGSTNIVDESGKVWTANGNTRIDTAQSKFGWASALFDGSGDYVDTPDSPHFALGAGDFTIDLWVKKNANNVTLYIAGQGNSTPTVAASSFQAAFTTANTLVSYWFWGTGASDYLTIVSTSTVTDTNWHHLAFVRSGNTITQYIDGVVAGSANATGKTINDSPSRLAVGRIGEYVSAPWNGWIDEFRFSKGIARWTSNFTPPNAPSGGLAFTPTATPSATFTPSVTPTASRTPTASQTPTAVTNTVTPSFTLTPTPQFGSLRAYWNFEAATGTSAPDEAVGDANPDSAILNAVTIENTGANGKSAFFNGTSSSATIANHAELNSSGSFTLSAWINPAAVVTSRTQYIVQKGAANKDYGFITVSTQGTATPTGPININADGSIAFQVGDLTPNTLAGPILPVDTWSLVTGVYNASANEMRLYINGELIASQTVTGTLSMSTAPLSFSPATNLYYGRLDEVKFYNGALMANEITNLYSSSVPTSTPTSTPDFVATATFAPSAIPTVTATPLPASAQQWGTGADGDLVVSGTFNINSDTNGHNGRTCADAAAFNVTLLGSTVASLDSSPAAGCLAVGDEVMLVQLTDSSPNGYNAGAYEFLRVASVTNNQVAFTTQKTRWYGNGWRSDSNIGNGAGQYRVMLMRVPNYNNVTVNGALVPSPFNGYKFGVVMFRVSNTLIGAGAISASGSGFVASSGYGAGHNGVTNESGGGAGYGTAGIGASGGGGAGGGSYGYPPLSGLLYGSGGGASGKFVGHCGSEDGCSDPAGGTYGGPGGGIVVITGNNINFAGVISSIGLAGGRDPEHTSLYGGGGSGGSIRIEGNTITVNSVTVTGGSRTGTNASGGSGRIAVYYQTSQSISSVSQTPYIALIGQALTPTPAPTSINLTSTPPSPWGNGRDGDLTVSGSFNLSTQKSGALTCVDGGDGVAYGIVTLSEMSAKLGSVPSLNCLASGDEVMLWHAYGSGPNVGTYEFLRVGGVFGDTVYFTAPKTKYYGSNAGDDSNVGSTQSVILQRVPNYQNVTVNGTLFASRMLIFRVANTLNGGGVISANGGGFGGSSGYGPGGTTTSKNKDGGGGGYGTNGQAAVSPGGSGGTAFGLPQLNTLFYGSGGGKSGPRVIGCPAECEQVYAGVAGSPGGGVILILGNNINFSGLISSNGSFGGSITVYSGTLYSGGGSGGSIRLEGNTVALNSVTVSGGGAGGSAGDGGLGRIAVYYQTSFTGNFSPGYLEQVNPNPSTTATPTPTATPAYDENVSALLHMDGADASTSFADQIGKVWTANGNAQIDTAQSKFGGASGLFDGTGDYVDTPDSEDFNVGSGDFTVDFWFRKNVNASVQAVYGQANSAAAGTSISMLLYVDQGGNYPYGAVYVGSTAYAITSPSAITDTNWHHYAFVRNGNTITLYVDGTSKGTVAVTGVTVNNSANKPTIGRPGEYASQYLNSSIDEFRFSKGIARWTSNFTPPSESSYNAPTPTTPPTGWQKYDYTYSATIPHAVTSVARPTVTDTYQYDANGNMTCRVEAGITYLQSYNLENRVASIAKLASGSCATPGNYAAKWDFAYDGDGTRTSTLYTPYTAGAPQTAVLTAYYFGGAYEVTGSAVKKYYSFGGQTILRDSTATGLQYFLTDHLGSTVAVTNASGTLTSQQRYLPFGGVRTNVTSPNSQSLITDLGYTGQRALDPGMGGLMDYHARFYSPLLGRFTQPDSLIPDASNPQAWNRYSYVINRPINLNDPSGHCFDPISLILCGAIAYVGYALYVGVRTVAAQPDGNNASNIWELMQLGVKHADHANITGKGLQSLQNDPSIQAAENRIVSDIRKNPNYGKQAFSIPGDYAGPKNDDGSFTADGPSGNWFIALVTGNQAFRMVHSANLYATNTKVSKNGTISTTWKVDDNFDYMPDWSNHHRKGLHYLSYNLGAAVSAPIYNGLLGAEKRFPTNAYWDETVPNDRGDRGR